jgi:hypothetical protein
MSKEAAKAAAAAYTESAVKAAKATKEALEKQTNVLKEVVVGGEASDPCACLREVMGGVQQTLDTSIPAVTEAVKHSEQTLVDTAQSTTAAVGRIADKSTATLVGALGNLGRYLGGAIKSISGGGGGSDIFGDVVKAFATYYASGFAGGGMIPAMAGGGLVTVGEEGRELVSLPGGSRVYNKRQMQFAGGGQTVNYQPSYNITIEGATDARDTEQRLAIYLAKRDAKLKNELAVMLKDNGYGRMR